MELNVPLNWYSSMKDSQRFEWFLMSKIDFESQILAFLTPSHYTNSQYSKISFDYPSRESSTTGPSV